VAAESTPLHRTVSLDTPHMVRIRPPLFASIWVVESGERAFLEPGGCRIVQPRWSCTELGTQLVRELHRSNNLN